ncbi:MAG: hypothetical protein WB795_23190, partial [Candidatus Acidiferrales bacterium]
PRSAAAVRNDQSRGTQQPKMLGDGRAAHGEVTRQFADGTAGDAQEAEDPTAGWMGQGAKDGLTVCSGCSRMIAWAASGSMGNHMVTP